jgi:hypothetical protein
VRQGRPYSDRRATLASGFFHSAAAGSARQAVGISISRIPWSVSLTKLATRIHEHPLVRREISSRPLELAEGGDAPTFKVTSNVGPGLPAERPKDVVGCSLAPGVRSNGYVLGSPPALRDYEEFIALDHHILDLRDEVRRQDDELARIASNSLVLRPPDGQDAFAILQAAFARHVDEGVGACVELLNRLVYFPRSRLVLSDAFLAKAH